MPSRRFMNGLGVLASALALGFAFFSQYVLGLQPCHLCVFQRIEVLVLGLLFLAVAWHSPAVMGARVYALLIGLAGLATAATAGRHLWVQMQPPGAVAPCGADLEFMLDVFPLTEVILKVFRAGGECQKVDFELLGISMPGWVLVFAVGITLFGVWNNWRRNAA